MRTTWLHRGYIHLYHPSFQFILDLLSDLTPNCSHFHVHSYLNAPAWAAVQFSKISKVPRLRGLQDGQEGQF